jgi:hypothetical protein
MRLSFLKGIALACVLGFKFLIAGPITFGDKNSTIKLASGTTMKVRSNLVNIGGTINKTAGSSIVPEHSISSLGFREGYFVESGRSMLLDLDYSLSVYELTQTKTVRLRGDKSILTEPGTAIDVVRVGGTGNKIEGTPKFNGNIFLTDGSIYLDNKDAELAFNISNQLTTSVNLAGGTVKLEADLKLADGVEFSGGGVLKFKGHQLSFGGTPMNLSSSILLDSASDMVLNSRIDLSGTWTFSSNASINGNGNVLDLGNTGKIWVQGGTELNITDLKIKGLRYPCTDVLGVGSFVFEDANSKLNLSNVSMEFDADFTFTEGTVLAEGPTTFVLSDKDVTFNADSLLKVDGETLWYDTLDKVAGNGGQIVATNVSLLNNGHIKEVGFGSLTVANSNAIIANSSAVLAHSNAISAHFELLKVNSSAILAHSNAVASHYGLLKANSSAILANSNANSAHFELLKVNSSAILANSNSVSSHYELLKANSSAVIANSNAINSHYGLLVNNSWAIQSIDSRLDFTEALSLANSSAILNSGDSLTKANSSLILSLIPLITANEDLSKANSSAILASSVASLALEQYNLLLDNSNAIVVHSDAIRTNSNAIVANSSAIRASSDAIAPHYELLKANSAAILAHSNAITPHYELLKTNSSAILASSNSINSHYELLTANSSAIVYERNMLNSIDTNIADLHFATNTTLTYDVSLASNHKIYSTADMTLDCGGRHIKFPATAGAVLDLAANVDLIIENVNFENFAESHVNRGSGSTLIFGDGSNIELGISAPTSLSTTWTFSKDASINGHGGVLDLGNTGKIWVQGGTTLSLNDLKIKGVRYPCTDVLGVGSFIFEDVNSKINLSNVSMEFDTDYTFTEGVVQVEGPTTFVLSDKDITFNADSLLTVDGETLWYDTLSKVAGTGGQVVATNVSLLNNGQVKEVGFGSLTVANSNALVAHSNAINSHYGLLTANSSTILAHSNAITPHYELLKANSSSILAHSNAINSQYGLLTANSSAILAQSNAINSHYGLLKANSSAILAHSNAITPHYELLKANSSAIFANSNAIIFNEERIRFNSNALIALNKKMLHEPLSFGASNSSLDAPNGTGIVHAQGWNGDGTILAVGGEDNGSSKEISLHSYNSSIKALTKIGTADFEHSSTVRSVKWHTSNNFLAVAGDATPTESKEVRVLSFDGSTLTNLANCFKQVGGALFSANWHPTGNYLAVGGTQAGLTTEIRVFSFNSSQGSEALTEIVACKKDHGGTVRSVAWHPTGNYLAVCGFTGLGGYNVRVFSFAGEALTELANCKKIHGGNFYDLDWSDDGNTLLAVGDIGTDSLYGRVYDFSGTALTEKSITIPSPGARIKSCKMFDGGTGFVTGGDSNGGGNNIHLYLFYSKLIKELTAGLINFGTSVNNVAVHPIDYYISAGGETPDEARMYPYSTTTLVQNNSNSMARLDDLRISDNTLLVAVSSATYANSWAVDRVDSLAQALDARLDSVDLAVSNLDTRVVASSSAIVSHSWHLVNLDERLVATTNAVYAQSWAIKSLDDKTAAADSALDTRLTTAETFLVNNSFAILELDTRLTADENLTTNNSWAIESLDDRLVVTNALTINNSWAAKALDDRVGTAETFLVNNSFAILELDARLAVDESLTINNSWAIKALDEGLVAVGALPDNNSWAIKALDERLGVSETLSVANSYAVLNTGAALAQANSAVIINMLPLLEANNIALITASSNAIFHIDKKVGSIDTAAADIHLTSVSTTQTYDLLLSDDHKMKIHSSGVLHGGGHRIVVNYDDGPVISLDDNVSATLSDVVIEGFREGAIGLGTNASLVFADNASLHLKAEDTLDLTWKFSGACKVEGDGRKFTMGTGGIVLIPGASLLMNNIELAGLSGNKISCYDDLATLSLRDVVWNQSASFTLTQGSVQFLNNVQMVGSGSFIYESVSTSTVHKSSTLNIARAMTLSYSPRSENRNLLAFINDSSRLWLSGATLHSTETGVIFTSGRVVVDDTCTFQSDATSAAEAITFGDGVDAANDVTVEVLPGSQIVLASGYLKYNNVSG